MNGNPFSSFWMGGYECTDKQNAFGNRVDFLTLTSHLQLIESDYKSLQPFGIKTVREGIRWSQVEKKPYEYDWTDVRRMIAVGQEQGMQQIWDICHFGFPDDLTPLHPMFARRFAALCTAFVEFYRSILPDETLIVTPINEVSFLSWLGGDVRGTAPYCVGQGWEVKYRLMKAYIEGVAALRKADPSIRILTTEPLVNVVPSIDALPDEILKAKLQHEHQYQALDILCGRMCPELGGSPEYLDLIGVNYYYNNQWVNKDFSWLPWANEAEDVRWRPLRSLLAEVYARYRKPIIISETSHSGEDRDIWIEFIGRECSATLKNDIPLYGVCLYPIIDRPDWDHLTPWHHSGLWDAELVPGQLPVRVLNKEYALALLAAQQQVQVALDKRDDTSGFEPEKDPMYWHKNLMSLTN